MPEQQGESETFTGRVFHYRWFVILLCIAIAVIAALGAPRLKPASDYRVFFSADNPQLLAYEALRLHYTNDDNILLVLEPPGGNVFTLEYLQAIAEVTEKAWQLPHVIRVDSITNYQYSRADGDTLVVADLFAAEQAAPNDLEAIRRIATQDPQLRNKLVSPQGDITGINLSILLPGQDPMTETPAVVSATRQIADELRRHYPGMNTYLTGVIMLNNAFAEASMVDMTTLIPGVFLVVLIMLTLMLRSLYAVLATLIVMLLSIMTAMGIAGWSGVPMTPPMAVVPIIIMTLAVANGVHLLLPTLKYMRQGRSKVDALLRSVEVNRRPIFLTNITTAIGFLSLNLTEVLPFHHMGNSAALGVCAAFVFTVVLMPALLAVFPLHVKTSSHARSSTTLMSGIAAFVTRHKARVVAVSLLLSVALIACIPRNVIDENLIQYFDSSIEFRRDSDYVNDHLTGTGFIDYSLGTTEGGVNEPAFLDRVEHFSQWLRQQPEVFSVNSITDTFKRLSSNMHGDAVDWYRIPGQRDLAAQYLLLYEMSLPYGLDLNNQVNLNKSATRVSVAVRNMSAREYIAFDTRVMAWMQEHMPELASMGSSPTMMFSHISMNNASSMLLSTSLALAGISLILIFALRSVPIGLVSLIPNLLPIGVAFGFWGLLNGEVGLGLSLVAATSLGIIVDDTVHFLSKYLRGRKVHGYSPEAAIHFAFTSVGEALAITSMALIAGFLVLSFSVFKLNSDMGVLTAATLGIAIVFDFLLLPALILMIESRGRKHRDSSPAVA